MNRSYPALSRLLFCLFSISGIFVLTSCAGVANKSAQRSAIRIEQEVERLLAALTLEEKISLVHATSKFSVAGVPRLGIPEMTLSDGPHGVREEISRHSWDSANWDTDFATYLPPLTMVAASWDPEIAKMHGTVLGREARHRHKDIILGPGVNLARLPLYGRNFEYFGEDPFLAARMVVQEVRAIQEQDVAACVKHYALNNQELNRWGVDAKPDERTLREVYLPAFEAAVKEGGAYSLMGGYNRVYGTNANQSELLVKKILKGDWKFDGVLLTDWHVDINTRDAALNGLDLEMGTHVSDYEDYFFAKPLRKAIQKGEISEAVLDDKVRRVLRLQLRIGMMDPNRLPGARNTAEHRAAAQHIAEQGVVLLKNSTDLLPLEKSRLRKILVMGPNANLAHGRGGGSSQVKSEYEVTPLQGLRNALGDGIEIQYLIAADSDQVQPIPSDFILTRHGGAGTPVWKVRRYADGSRQAELKREDWPASKIQLPEGSETQYLMLYAKLKPLANGEHVFKLQGSGSARIKIDGREVLAVEKLAGNIHKLAMNLSAEKVYEIEFLYDGNKGATLGWDAPGLKTVAPADYIAAAKNADAVIYFAGLDHNHDREGDDRTHMALPGIQDKVIADLAAANPTTVVVMIAGSAVEMPWVNKVNALLWAWYGGMEAGNAYARVLLGDVNPSGKMPITLPKQLADTAPIALNDYNDKDSLYKEGIFIGYRWFEQQNIQPLFPFGHGISYTQFELSNLKLPAKVSASSETTPINLTVRNLGKKAGAEVVQLYLHDVQASVERPEKELKGFQKVFLQPGEAKEITLHLSQRDLAFWDVNTQDWRVEPGEFQVMVGVSSADIRLQDSFIRE
ncbi:MAG: glycoside hydrolase family 3 C-terminal domain-containing protein [Cellvibrionaceae bacterium]|nr:glycoside hydrolase family 3 C-terminal domain-containing protein [Cellvibrionaceae bacterium]